MNKRKEAREPDARGRILATAAEVFSKVGFDAARVDDIAERAGVNKAMLYYHVGDKQALYTAVLVETIDRAIAMLAPVAESDLPPTDRLNAIIDTLSRFGTSNPVLTPIVLREIASGGANLPDAMVLKMSSVFNVVARVLGEGVAAGEFRKTNPLLTHVTLVGSIMFLVASRAVRARLTKVAGIEEVDMTPADLATHIQNVFVHGIAADSAPPERTPAVRSRK